MTTYISHTDTNKLIRKALKAAFPGVKFRVAGSDGLSTRVSWEDGPSEDAVEKVTGRFHGASFDGMTDSTTYLTDTDDEGNTVHYGVNWVRTYRTFTEATTAAATAKACELMGVDSLDYGGMFEGLPGVDVNAVRNYTGAFIPDHATYADTILRAVAAHLANHAYAGTDPDQPEEVLEDTTEVVDVSEWTTQPVETYAAQREETPVQDVDALLADALSDMDPRMIVAFKMMDAMIRHGLQ